MNSYERVMRAFNNETPDRIPVIPLFRDWCTKQGGFKVSESMVNAEKYVYSQFYSVKKFGYDAVFDLDGVHAESEAMGCVLKIAEDSPPMVIDHIVKDYASDLKNLRIPDPQKDGRLPLILKGIEQLKSLCENEIPVIGYTQGPYRHASMLRGPENIMRDAYKNPDAVKDLLEIALESLIVYGTAVANAGADIIMITDPTSSADAVSKKHWEKFGFPYTFELVKALKRTGCKIFIHICGDTSDRLTSFVELGVDGISLDEKVDLGEARRIVGNNMCLIGNVSPAQTLLFGKPEEVAEESKRCIDSVGRQGGFILSSGCLVPAQVPTENIEAMVKVAKEYSI